MSIQFYGTPGSSPLESDKFHCNTCGNDIYPGMEPPAVHKRSCVIRRTVRVSRYDSITNQIIADGGPIPKAFSRAVKAQKQARNQNTFEAMKKAELAGTPRYEIKKTYIKTSGVIPGEDVVLDERIVRARAIAAKKRQSQSAGLSVII